MSRVCTLDDDRRDAVESFVADWLTDESVPSAGVALVDGDDVVYADGFGARDLESNAPASAETMYGVASVTKSFVATSVLQLERDGHLDLDDSVTEHVDYFSELADPPTVHELLSHTSGMPSDGASVALIAGGLRGRIT
ncbi:serine hydrolase domain-containing protein, partial [Halobacterium bonnevillei]